MNGRDALDDRIAAWFAHEAGDGAPDYLDAVLDRVERTGQRRAWTSLPRFQAAGWIGRRFDLAPAPLLLILLALLLGAIVLVSSGGGSTSRRSEHSAVPAPSHAAIVPPSEPRGSWPEAARATALAFHGSDFYAVPGQLAVDRAGAVVYVERADVMSYGRMYRVLYHSRSVDGRDTAVSGTIWVPASPAPTDGFPIVSFAMDNDGSGDRCAASRLQASEINASYGNLISLLVGEGYVVAYTDYEGLGTTEPYPFGVLPSAAHTMLDAARAARDLLGSAASDRVVLLGHGIGGDAATTAGELAAAYAPDIRILGVMAADGGDGDHAAALRDFVAAGDASDAPTGFLQYVDGYSVAFPELHPTDVLTAAGLEDLDHLDSTCWAQLNDLVSGHSANDVIAVNPLDIPRWAKRIEAMTVTTAPYPTVLLATGDPDPGSAQRRAAARFCADNDAVLYLTYPRALLGARDLGKDPSAGVYAVAWPEERRWIAERLLGITAAGNCEAIR
jgi:hypothetical protein